MYIISWSEYLNLWFYGNSLSVYIISFSFRRRFLWAYFYLLLHITLVDCLSLREEGPRRVLGTGLAFCYTTPAILRDSSLGRVPDQGLFPIGHPERGVKARHPFLTSCYKPHLDATSQWSIPSSLMISLKAVQDTQLVSQLVSTLATTAIPPSQLLFCERGRV